MADLGFTVTTDELPEAKDFSPVPAGRYTVLVTDSKLVPTKATLTLMEQSGFEDYDAYRKVNREAEGYLVVEMDIQDGGQAGRKLFHNLNLINKSTQAAEIAAGQLRQILEAFGMKTFSGKSEELHGKRMIVDVKIKEGKSYVKDGVTVPGQPQNNCVKFSSPSGTTGAVATQATGTTGKGAPWARG